MNPEIACLLCGAKVTPDERLLLVNVAKVMFRDKVKGVEFLITDESGMTTAVRVTTSFELKKIETVSGIEFSIELISDRDTRTVTCLVSPDLTDEQISQAEWRDAFFTEPQNIPQN